MVNGVRLPGRNFLTPQRGTLRARKLPWAIALGVLCCGLVIAIFTPWRGSIWQFDPDAVARLEADMWRHYYEKRFVALAFDLYAGVRENYRISPFDATLVAWDAAQAAKVFQASRSRQAAGKAIPILERSYRRLARATDAKFDPRRAATLELEWWQQRRERVPTADYARTIARLAQEIYSRGDDPLIATAALERAEAMAFRDAHRTSGMTEADWDVVAGKLTRSYRLLHDALVGGGPDRAAASPGSPQQGG